MKFKQSSKQAIIADTFIFAAVSTIYSFLISLYTLIIRIAALFNPKAALWINGRKNLLQKIRTTLPANEQRIWIHCASLGEFEQGRPVLEAFRKQYPAYKIVLTFFSPSGYEVRKDYDGADYIFYLPMDGKQNAKAFMDAVNPRLVIFVKYEFWYYYLSEIKRRNIPALLISAAFRQDQAFFKWYGGLFRKMLSGFTKILVQDQTSKDLLAQAGFTENVIIGGDTRYDRVAEISTSAKNIPEVDSFKGEHKIIIAGSTWPLDEEALKAALPSIPADWKLIIAPHEIDAAHISNIMKLFGNDAVLFSGYKLSPQPEKKILVIDNIGMLSSLYCYGNIAFVGGGFDKSGIHNVLEPAVFGTPVIIGPVYKKFVEAVQLVKLGFVFPVEDESAFSNTLQRLIHDETERKRISNELLGFMQENRGATKKIMGLIASFV